MFSAIVQVELYTYWGTQASPLNIESSLGYLSSKKKSQTTGAHCGEEVKFLIRFGLFMELRWVFSQKKKKRINGVFLCMLLFVLPIVCVYVCMHNSYKFSIKKKQHSDKAKATSKQHRSIFRDRDLGEVAIF